MYNHIIMKEIAALTSVLFYDPRNGNREVWSVVGNEDQGARLVERIVQEECTILEITECNLPYREQVFGALAIRGGEV